jgi:hypothetical protein
MIKKKGRGGARKNAGRKKVIKDLSWIDIGILCERLQKEEGERLAIKAHQQRPVTRKIREFQKLVVKHRITDDVARDRLWKVYEEEYNVRTKPGDWVVRLKRRRAATREQIIARVSDACMKLGRLRVTPRRVEACWDRYRSFLEESRAAGRGEIATESDLLEAEAELAKMAI